MASEDEKISQLPAATSLSGMELVPIVQGGVNKTATPTLLNSSVSGGGNKSFTTVNSNGGTVVLTTAQAATGKINVTGSPTSDVILVFPASTTGRWSVANQTVNPNPNYNSWLAYQTAFNVKCKVVGQSNTVNTLPGLSKAMWSDGTVMRADDSDCAGAALQLNFADWAGTSYVTIVDLTTLIQNFLLYCQLVALNLKAHVLDDQMQRLFVTAYFPRGTYLVSCPIVVPSLVNWKMDGTLYRNAIGGTVTNVYTGDTTTQALANLIQPTLIIAPQGHAETVNIYCDPDGGHAGSGVAFGKNWEALTVSIGAAGTGYQIGDNLFAACPLMPPYRGFNCHVTSIGAGGSVTGISALTDQGAYDLPPVLQKQQWTTANGYAVFDGSGYFLTTTSGSGTGATLNPTWQVDFVGGDYWGGQGGLISDTIIGHVNVISVGQQNDPTYGPCFGSFFWGLNFVGDEIESGGGYYGIWFQYASDVRFNKLNPVNAVYNLAIQGGNSINCDNVVLDTSFGGAFLKVDNTSTVKLKGVTVNGGRESGPHVFAIGQSSSSGGQVVGCTFEFIAINCGTTAGVPAFYLDYCQNVKIDVTVSNKQYDGTPNTYLCTSLAEFGSHNGSGVEIRGTMDGAATTSLYSGSSPVIGNHVWDGSVHGFSCPAGTYMLYGSGAPTNGTTGLNKAGKVSLYFDYTNGNVYKNTGTAAATVWVNLGSGGATSVLPTKHQIVANQCIVPNTTYQPSSISRTDLRIETRYQHTTGIQPVSQLLAGVVGFILSPTGEQFLGNNYTWECAVEITSPSTFSEMYALGSNLVTVVDGNPTTVNQSPVCYPMSAGESFWVRQASSIASDTLFLPIGEGSGPSGSQGIISPSVTSQVPGTGSLTTPAGGTSFNDAGPALILGIPVASMAAVAFFGDSIADGTGDTVFNPLGDKGFIGRGLASVNSFPMPYLKITVGSWSFQYSTLAYAPRMLSLLPYVTHFICQMGTNDIASAVTLSQMQTYATNMWQSAKNIVGPYGKILNVAQVLIMPRTTSVQYAATATVAAGGSGYASSSTFNVTLAGGTLAGGASATTVSVTTNGSGVVTTVNSIANHGGYASGSTPATPNSPTGGTGTGLSLTLTFGGWTSAADQTPVAGFTTGGVRDLFNAWVKTQVGGGLLDAYIDANQYVEDPSHAGCWLTNGTINYPSTDGVHPDTAFHILAAQAVNSWAAGITP